MPWSAWMHGNGHGLRGIQVVQTIKRPVPLMWYRPFSCQVVLSHNLTYGEGM